MDDYSISSLVESKNEWCARLVSILSNTTITGIMAIFKEAITLCENDGNEAKYLMTFQNLLSRIPQWNPSIIESERKRIETESRCKYIEDLITCVHIIQLKALTCVRVGQKQKKIDLDIPSVDKFIHQVYINVARKLYTNIYLFEKDILPLQIQKNNRELELLVKESILLTIRNNIPIEDILKVYIDETDEQNVEVTEQEIISKKQTDSKDNSSDDSINKTDNNNLNISSSVVDKKDSTENSDTIKLETTNEPQLLDKDSSELKLENLGDVSSVSIMDNNKDEDTSQTIGFSDIDKSFFSNGKVENVDAPKTIERLNQISMENNERRKEEDADDDDDKLVLGDNISLDIDEIPLSGDDIDLGAIEILG